MGLINEEELISTLSNSKNVLLIEPPYRRSYIPLGLAKISTFVKSHGGKTTYSRRTKPGKFDLICIATCFTTDSEKVISEIRHCKQSLFLRNTRIIVGGIFASLMPNYIIDKTKVDVFCNCSDILDSCLPDYNLDYQIEGFFKEAMTLFTTRGCPNKCGYCMVHKIEKDHKIIPSWKDNIEKINKETCVVSDNNLLSFPIQHIKDVVDCLNSNKKKVIFNNGVDCRLINNENAKLLASLKYTRNGFRTAFDRMSDDGHYQKAMEKVLKVGLKIKGNSITYVLCNFKDTPQEAYYQLKESWRYGSVPYLMNYRPLDKLKKTPYIGEYWTKNLIKAFKTYGEIYGFNTGDRTFESWVKNSGDKGKSKIYLTDEDWDKWNYRR